MYNSTGKTKLPEDNLSRKLKGIGLNIRGSPCKSRTRIDDSWSHIKDESPLINEVPVIRGSSHPVTSSSGIKTPFNDIRTSLKYNLVKCGQLSPTPSCLSSIQNNHLFLSTVLNSSLVHFETKMDSSKDVKSPYRIFRDVYTSQIKVITPKGTGRSTDDNGSWSQYNQSPSLSDYFAFWEIHDRNEGHVAGNEVLDNTTLCESFDTSRKTTHSSEPSAKQRDIYEVNVIPNIVTTLCNLPDWEQWIIDFRAGLLKELYVGVPELYSLWLHKFEAYSRTILNNLVCMWFQWTAVVNKHSGGKFTSSRPLAALRPRISTPLLVDRLYSRLWKIYLHFLEATSCSIDQLREILEKKHQTDCNKEVVSLGLWLDCRNKILLFCSSTNTGPAATVLGTCLDDDGGAEGTINKILFCINFSILQCFITEIKACQSTKVI